MRRVLAVMLVLVGSAVAAEAQALRPTEMLTLSFAGMQRRVAVYAPRSYRPGMPVPLVFAFHGGGGYLAVSVARYGLQETAERAGFLAVFPEGLPQEDQPGGLYWTDDVNPPYIGHVLDVLQGRYAVDARRVYAMGFSGGAKLCYQLAADPSLSRRLAAIGTVAGSITERTGSGLPRLTIDPTAQGGMPMSVFLVQGARDPRQPLDGGLDFEGMPELSFEEKVRIWISHTGASAPVSVAHGHVPSRADVQGWMNPATRHTVVALVDPQLAHSWPDWPMADTFWDFFQAVPPR